MDPVREPSTFGPGTRMFAAGAVALAMAFVTGAVVGTGEWGLPAWLLLTGTVTLSALTLVAIQRWARREARGIEDLRCTMQEVADTEDLSLRADFFGEGSSRSLSSALNLMLDALERREQRRLLDLDQLNLRLEQIECDRRDDRELRERLERAERMESLGILAGGVAHDLNNLLGPLVGYPDLLAERLPDDDRNRRPLATIKDAALRSAAVIQDLLTLARRESYELETVDLGALLHDLPELDEALRQRLRSAEKSFELVVDEALPPVLASAPHLAQAVRNLLLNAIEWRRDGAPVCLEARRVLLDERRLGYERIPPGSYVRVTVPGGAGVFSERHFGRIFEPFYWTKGMGRDGSGLGLAVVWGVIKDLGGYVDLEAGDDGVCAVSLWLPETEGAARRTMGVRSLEGRERILVVDDEKVQRETARAVLQSLGYRIETCRNGTEALARLEREEFDLALLDLTMEAEFDGLDLLAKMRLRCPDQRCLVATGFVDEARRRHARHLGAVDLIGKPYTRETIGSAVRRALDLELVDS
jgi:signal transduction histidine kinase/ActR/RegA family two-component response regulator